MVLSYKMLPLWIFYNYLNITKVKELAYQATLISSSINLISFKW
jgi:hypothetical protein